MTSQARQDQRAFLVPAIESRRKLSGGFWIKSDYKVLPWIFCDAQEFGTSGLENL